MSRSDKNRIVFYWNGYDLEFYEVERESEHQYYLRQANGSYRRQLRKTQMDKSTYKDSIYSFSSQVILDHVSNMIRRIRDDADLLSMQKQKIKIIFDNMQKASENVA